MQAVHLFSLVSNVCVVSSARPWPLFCIFRIYLRHMFGKSTGPSSQTKATNYNRETDFYGTG